MNLEGGMTVRLGRTEYRIGELLGGGAVADVYPATITGVSDSEVVIKLVRSGTHDSTLIEGMRREAEVLRLLNKDEDEKLGIATDPVERLRRAQETVHERRVIALLDSGELEDGRPFLIQEMAPPAFRRFDIKNLNDEYRMLSIALAVTKVLVLAHKRRLALKDFEPPTKVDRIRLKWRDEQQGVFDLKIIDWNITGDRQDIPKDLLYLGLHLFYFFTGGNLMLREEKQMPVNLRSVAPPIWEDLTQGTRQILQRLLHRDPERRYRRASEVASDIEWWADILERVRDSRPFNRLQERAREARYTQRRYDRLLAVAELALSLSPPENMEGSFRSYLKQAREELDRELWRPLASARATLSTGGAYQQAVKEFRQVLNSLPADSDPARLARIYVLLAQAGEQLKNSHKEDIRSTPEWETLNRAVKHLTERQWEEAQGALGEFIQYHPEAEDWQSIKGMRALAKAGLRFREANRLSEQAASRSAEAGRDDWTTIEKKRLSYLEQAVEHFKEARDLFPQEPDFVNRLRMETERLNLRNELLGKYESVDSLTDQGEKAFRDGEQSESKGDYESAAEFYQQAVNAYRKALDTLDGILKYEARQPQHRARFLQERLRPRINKAERRHKETQRQAEKIRQATEVWEKAQTSLKRGKYSTAQEHLQKAVKLLPDNQEWQESLRISEVAAGLEQQAERFLNNARLFFENRRFDEAAKAVQKPLGWHLKSLADLPGGEQLTGAASASPFLLREDLRKALNELSAMNEDARQAYEQVRKAREDGDYNTVVTALENLHAALKENDFSLNSEENEWLEEARKKLEVRKKVRGILENEPNFEQLRDVIEKLADDHGEEAKELREKAGKRWLAKVRGILENEPDFEQLRDVIEKLEGDHGEEAKELREKAGKRWLALVEKLEHLNEVRERLEEGRKLFSSEEATIGRLEKMLSLTKAAGDVEKDLAQIEEGDTVPVWMKKENVGETLVELEEHLAKLEEHLAKLKGRESWPWLRERGERWRSDLASYLGNCQGEVLQEVRSLSRKKDFTSAAKELRSFRSTVPDTFRPDGWNRIEQFLSQLEQREQADRALARIVERIENRTLTFTEAAEEIGSKVQLPDEQDIPVDDLKAIIEEIKRGSSIEKVLSKQPTDTTYATVIQELRRLSGEEFKHLPEGTVQGLQENLLKQLKKIEQELPQKLQEACAAAREKPESKENHGRLVALYWQTRWWRRLMSPHERTEEQDARQVVQELLAKAGELFLGMNTPNDLKQVITLLDAVQDLNGRLNQVPSEGLLPPLPQGIEYERSEPPVNNNDLRIFRNTAAYLYQLRAEESQEVKAILENVRQTSKEIQKHLNDLEQVWTSSLQLQKWSEKCTPVLTREEAQVYPTLAEKLEEARRLLDEKQAMKGLEVLDKGEKERKRLDGYSLQLLEEHRKSLKSAFDRLKGRLTDTLADQVADILRERRETAIQRLREEILLIPTSKTLAESAYRAIKEGVSKRAQEAQEAGRRDEARALWKTVVQATEPWA